MAAVSTLARPRPSRLRRALPLLGLLLLGWVLSRLDLGAMRAALGKVSFGTLLVSCVWFSANLWLKVFRWQRLLAAQGILLPHRVALASFMSGQFYAQVTVGRVGEFLRVEALTERGVGAGSALASCVFDRLLDVFLVLATGAVLGAFVVGSVQAAFAALITIALLSLCVAWFLLALATRSDGSAAPAQRWLQRVARSPLLARLAKALVDMATGMRPMLRPAALAEAALWTVIAWTGYFAALFALADGLQISVSWVLLTATAALAALTSLLPITVSGLGARELVYIHVLTGQGVPDERAVALSLLHLAVMTALAIVLGLAGVVARQRQRL